jgi:hypothetical protein
MLFILQIFAKTNLSSYKIGVFIVDLGHNIYLHKYVKYMQTSLNSDKYISYHKPFNEDKCIAVLYVRYHYIMPFFKNPATVNIFVF